MGHEVNQASNGTCHCRPAGWRPGRRRATTRASDGARPDYSLRVRQLLRPAGSRRLRAPAEEPPAAPRSETAAARVHGCGERFRLWLGMRGCRAADAAPEMFHLFESSFTKKWGLVIGGWTTQSFTWNPYNPSNGPNFQGRNATRFNGPVTWTDQANQYQLNQQYLYFDRPTNTGGDGWDLGGRVDLLYGTDYRFTTEAGLENKINSPNNPYMGLAIPQFYGEVAYNNLKVKLGHFYSPVGYFVVPTINNFFNTLPYTFQYGEPFTHSGFLATWTANEHWTLGGGLINGWDNFFGGPNPNLGSLTTATGRVTAKTRSRTCGCKAMSPMRTPALFRLRSAVACTPRVTCKQWSIPSR